MSRCRVCRAEKASFSGAQLRRHANSPRGARCKACWAKDEAEKAARREFHRKATETRQRQVSKVLWVRKRWSRTAEGAPLGCTACGGTPEQLFVLLLVLKRMGLVVPRDVLKMIAQLTLERFACPFCLRSHVRRYSGAIVYHARKCAYVCSDKCLVAAARAHLVGKSPIIQKESARCLGRVYGLNANVDSLDDWGFDTASVWGIWRGRVPGLGISTKLCDPDALRAAAKMRDDYETVESQAQI